MAWNAHKDSTLRWDKVDAQGVDNADLYEVDAQGVDDADWDEVDAQGVDDADRDEVDVQGVDDADGLTQPIGIFMITQCSIF